MLAEFKAFIMKGNLIDLAVALVLGLAFTALVTSFVESLINPIVALIFGQPDLSSLTFEISDSVFFIGNFLGTVIDFVLIGLVLFFVVKGANKMMAKKEEEPEVAVEETPEDVELLRQIRDQLAART